MNIFMGATYDTLLDNPRKKIPDTTNIILINIHKKTKSVDTDTLIDSLRKMVFICKNSTVIFFIFLNCSSGSGNKKKISFKMRYLIKFHLNHFHSEQIGNTIIYHISYTTTPRSILCHFNFVFPWW